MSVRSALAYITKIMRFQMIIKLIENSTDHYTALDEYDTIIVLALLYRRNAQNLLFRSLRLSRIRINFLPTATYSLTAQHFSLWVNLSCTISKQHERRTSSSRYANLDTVARRIGNTIIRIND